MTTTKHIVLSRVRTIHYVRPFVSTGALCVALGAVSLYAISREVWVAMVLRNMPEVTDVVALAGFFTSAFLHTGILVQVFSVVALGAAFFLVRESMRTLPTLVSLRA
jgi:hypothetical protein